VHVYDDDDDDGDDDNDDAIWSPNINDDSRTTIIGQLNCLRPIVIFPHMKMFVKLGYM